jgi:acyl-CoA thioesterase I
MKLLILLLMLFSSYGFAKTVLFIGDSLTEGYQLAKEDAYPAVIERSLKPKYPGLKIINAGVSGATTASGPARMSWYLKSKPDIIVLALGANDGLRGLDLSESEKNLSAIIERAQSQSIQVLLVGMKMPPNYGASYRQKFEKLFPQLAQKYKLPLVPFILEGVGGNPKLNLPDGIHPNVEGQKVMASIVQKYLEPLL